jgi:hypothetical protein
MNIESAKTASVVVFALFILLLGYFILRSIADEKASLWRKHLGDHVLQIVGLTFILPVVMVISVAIDLESQAVTALLGAIIGSIFGSAAAAGSKSSDSDVTKTEGIWSSIQNSMKEDSARSDRRFNELLGILARNTNAPPASNEQPSAGKTPENSANTEPK